MGSDSTFSKCVLKILKPTVLLHSYKQIEKKWQIECLFYCRFSQTDLEIGRQVYLPYLLPIEGRLGWAKSELKVNKIFILLTRQIIIF